MERYKDIAECTFREFEKANPLAARAIRAAAEGGATLAISGFAQAVGSKSLSRWSFRIGAAVFIYEEIKVMTDFIRAFNLCDSEVCVTFVAPINVTKQRAWYNPMRYIIGPTYICLECPAGSDEVAEPAPGERVTRASTN